MKYWSGKDFDYRGYHVKNNKKDGFLEVYDKYNNYTFGVNSFGKGCVTDVKNRIDDLIKRYGNRFLVLSTKEE